MGGFLSSIFTGSAPGLDNAEGNAGNVAGFGTSIGEGDTRTASDYFDKILGGDPAAISKLFAPQIGQIAGQANQKIQTEGEFGNRSGGTNAGNQQTVDSTRANVDNMISGATSGAAGSLASMGQNLLNTGLSADQLQAKLAEEKMQNQQNSLLGGLISKGVSTAAGAAGGGLGTIVSGLGSGNYGW